MKDQDILNECQEFVRRVESDESSNRVNAVEALDFANGDQWPDTIETARTLENRPCLTVNKTDAIVRQVINGMRQQRPRMTVHPVGDGSDVEKAEVIKGVLRHIEMNSNADVAYDIANEFQIRMGWGYWRVAHRYISEDSFDQELYIDPIDNPFTVFFDPSSTLPDGSDNERTVVLTMMRRDELKRRWPSADACEFSTMGQGTVSAWANEAEVMLGEYWRVDKEKDTLITYSNGWSGFKSKMDQKVVELLKLTVERERPTYRRTVTMYLCTAREILETKVWAGRYIPIIPVYGNRLNINGTVERSGMIKNLMDPARMYNFWRTSEAEIVALAPKAPWVMADGQDEGHEAEWDTANTKSYSRLLYKPITSEDGTPLPPPMRQQPQQIPTANVNAANGAAEDMKAVSGIYDAGLGDRQQDPSGIALSRHQQQSENSNFHFYDNFCRSLRFTGVVILDLMPTIYDTERVLRMIGEDGEPENVTLNEKKRDEAGAVAEVLNDVTVGRYDIVMDTGPGYNTKRIESADNMLKLLGTPVGEKIAAVADDIIVRSMDFPGARDLADRLAAANPLAQEEQLPDFPPEAQAMIKQLKGQAQQMQQAIQHMQLEEKYRIKAIELREGSENKRHDITEQNENMRHQDTLATKTHDVGMRDATKRHDTEMRSLTQQSVADIAAQTQLMLKGIDGKHLEREIDAENARTRELANQNEPVER